MRDGRDEVTRGYSEEAGGWDVGVAEVQGSPDHCEIKRESENIFSRGEEGLGRIVQGSGLGVDTSQGLVKASLPFICFLLPWL